MSRKLLSFLLLIVLSSYSFGQATDKSTAAEDTAKLEKDAVEFLRETAGDVGRMRSMENRISFSAELASLMWFHDEKEAKQMYGGVVSDFKQLISQFDVEMNALELPADEGYGGGGFLFGGYGRSKVERKFRIAMAVRQQIATSLAEHAPDLAYNFFYDSKNLISNEKFRKETDQSDKYFEFQLMKQIAESDAAKAADYGRESIKGGLDNNHIELLKKIYAKDEDKGIEFGAAILSRLKTDKTSVKSTYFYNILLTFGAENLNASKKPGTKKAIYSQSDLRDIAEEFAQFILNAKDQEGSYSAIAFADQIEKYAPGRAAQIRTKFKQSKTGSTKIGNFPANSYSGSGAVSGGAYAANGANRATGIASNTLASKAEEDRLAHEKIEKKLIDDVKGLASKTLPKEERDKVVAQARKIISETKGKEKKIVTLSLLAAQVARLGDKDLANEIMLDAERLVNPQPKNYQDFLYTWMLASGYAETNPDKAFPMLEDTIARANGTISAFVKVAEFIDIQEELIADGEVQVGMFGGSMIREMTSGLGMASGTIKSLVKADFAKTKGLTNTFDRLEIRVLAKMMVLRAVLDKREKKPTDVDEMLLTDGDSISTGDDGPVAVTAPAPTKPRSK